VISPVYTGGVCVSIRRFATAPTCEEKALSTGWMDERALEILKDVVRNRKNIIISGGTSTGKTSLLNFLCQYFGKRERILTIEDTVELQPPVANLIQLQARKPNADGVGEITLRSLIQCALRLRPDRIIVGECRGNEVIEMLQALNTGHPGSITTIHANSTREALSRLELLAMLGATNLTIQAIRRWIASTIEIVIQVDRDILGQRFVAEIAHIKNKENEIGSVATVYKRTSSQKHSEMGPLSEGTIACNC
jgi:pilus assembly protein CpaF